MHLHFKALVGKFRLNKGASYMQRNKYDWGSRGQKGMVTACMINLLGGQSSKNT